MCRAPPKWQLVHQSPDVPVPNVKFGVATIESAIINVALPRCRARPEPRAFVDTMRPSIGMCGHQAVAHTLGQAGLQAVVNRIGIRQLIGYAGEYCPTVCVVLWVSD